MRGGNHVAATTLDVEGTVHADLPCPEALDPGDHLPTRRHDLRGLARPDLGRVPIGDEHGSVLDNLGDAPPLLVAEVAIDEQLARLVLPNSEDLLVFEDQGGIAVKV